MTYDAIPEQAAVADPAGTAPPIPDRPEDALDLAFERARQIGYQQGSPEMDALHLAEARYQQRRRV